jgi:hypothetical protein
MTSYGRIAWHCNFSNTFDESPEQTINPMGVVQKLKNPHSEGYYSTLGDAIALTDAG